MKSRTRNEMTPLDFSVLMKRRLQSVVAFSNSMIHRFMTGIAAISVVAQSKSGILSNLLRYITDVT